MKQFLILACLASAPLAGLRAQGSAVLYGSVHDTLGQPLRAYVRLLEGGRAALADGRGRYRLAVPAGTVFLEQGISADSASELDGPLVEVTRA